MVIEKSLEYLQPIYLNSSYPLVFPSIQFTEIRRLSPSRKTTIPENSWRNPWAASAPILVAINAVAVSLTILAKIAIGAADTKRIIFFLAGNVDRNANAPLRANMVTRERRPEQAATTSRVVCARWMTLPSLYTGMPNDETTCSVK